MAQHPMKGFWLPRKALQLANGAPAIRPGSGLVDDPSAPMKRPASIRRIDDRANTMLKTAFGSTNDDIGEAFIAVALARWPIASRAQWLQRRKERRRDNKIAALRSQFDRHSRLTTTDQMFKPWYLEPAECHWHRARSTHGANSEIRDRRATMRCWAVISLAGQAVRHTLDLDIWKGPELQQQGIRPDLDEQLTSLTNQALAIADVMYQLGAPPQHTDPGALCELYRRNLHSTEIAWEALVERLEALLTYTSRVAELQNYRDRIAHETREETRLRELQSRSDDLLASSGADTIGAEQIHASARSVDDLSAAQETAWKQLRGDYNSLLATPGAIPPTQTTLTAPTAKPIPLQGDSR